MHPHRLIARAAALSVALFAALPLLAAAQVTVKPDGKFRYLLGAAASYASGNTKSSALNLTGDAVRATADDKLSFKAQAVYGSTDDKTTAERLALDGQYDRDLTPKVFWFAAANALRDKPANLASRFGVAAGAGYHVIRDEATTFDVSAGLGYTRDSFVDPVVVRDALRDNFGRAELVLGEESTHKLGETTSAFQKLSLRPDLEHSGQFLANFDSGISVAMNKTLSLTAGLSYRYNSDPGVGFKKGDTLFVTGVTARFD